MATSYKTSISLQAHVWELLKQYQNRSSVINEALEIFFDRKTSLDQAEKTYWDKVHQSIQGNSGDYTALNNKNKPVTDEMLDEALWK